MHTALVAQFVCLLMVAFHAWPQQIQTVQPQSPAPQDPQAVSLALQALSAMTGGVSVGDATLTGTATRIAGSDLQSGTVTLKAKGTNASRIVLDLSGGAYAEVRNSTQGYPQGSWSGADGVVHASSLHNCFTDSVWFFPPLASLAASVNNLNYAVAYVGQETREGTAVQHLRFSQSLPTTDAATLQLLTHLSTVDVWLDSTSGLPAAVGFMIHPDDNGNMDIPVEIRYSNYQVSSGVRVPLHVQKYINNGLVLDLNLTALTLNSGLPDSDFNL